VNDDKVPSNRYYEGPDRALEEVMRLQSRAFSRFFDLIVREFIGTERFSGILDEAINIVVDSSQDALPGMDSSIITDGAKSAWEEAGYPVDPKGSDPGC